MNGWSKTSGDLRTGLRFYALYFLIFVLTVFASNAQAQGTCDGRRIVRADVVALDMPLMFNRLGAQNINGMMYALKRDVVVFDPADPTAVPPKLADPNHLKPLTAPGVGAATSYAGRVALRPDKRPRPLVLRTGKGDCLEITLTNLLATPAGPDPANPFNAPQERSNVVFNVQNDNQVAARRVSLRFQGTELVGSIADDGTYVGANGTLDSVPAPGEDTTYTVLTIEDGAFLGVSYGGTVGGEGQGGQTASGLWAVLNVNPEGAVFYRSVVTREELDLVTQGTTPMPNGGHPMIDYEAVYPPEEPWISEGKAGLPVLNMITPAGDYAHTAIDAIVAFGDGTFQMTAPGAGNEYEGYLGHFPNSIYPLENVQKRNPTVPNRLEPFREFTVAFHDEVQTTQVYPKWYNDPVLGHTLHGVRDSFMINYGSGGIGSEIISNRLGVGPMHDCVNCAYEEFFLTFHAVGEVGQVTDIPANMGLENCDPTLANCGATGPKANYVLYPGDPSNVHHSYVGDNTAFRNLHAGPGEQHVFHLHNHQWLFNADDDNSNYLDAQGLGPGAGYAYWINFGGSGNRNKTAGDAIFHCHFYPHFAQGMWEMWRIHDAFESGTKLEVTANTTLLSGYHNSWLDAGDSYGIGIGNGTPAIGDADNRALPDGEIVAGAPTPAVVPLPGKPLAPMPGNNVGIVANSNMVEVCGAPGAQVLPNPDGTCPGGLTFDRPVGSLSQITGDRTKNPGYPFWIAGMEHTVGNRPPTPPLDMITHTKGDALFSSGNPLWGSAGWTDANAIDGWDGGLPRFAVEGFSAGGHAAVAITRLDMSKDIEAAKPVFFPEEGTDLEQAAMAFHASRCHDSYRVTVDGSAVLDASCIADPNHNTDGLDVGLTPKDGAGNPKTHHGFLTNGALPIAGAPFQEPCIDDRGVPMEGATGFFFDGKSSAPIWDTSAMTTEGASPFKVDSPRVYKAANVQFDAVLNKLGYHFPQQRIITLWQDVVPTINQERPPEPFVLRMNTFDCTQYVHSNVVPKAYELDDYQVRTPTDIIGQHIHLPKWDLTSADGSANGWNYEDGTLSPEAVIEMIRAINAWNVDARDDLDPATEPVTTVFVSPTESRAVEDSAGNALGGGVIELTDTVAHPFFGGTDYADRWVGARSTLQRWFADPVVNVQGVDRGLGIIFTHDHYGPSTHQQIGLYATVLIEPAGSKWVHNDTGTPLYTRTGGAPAMNDGGPTSWQAAILTGENGLTDAYGNAYGSAMYTNVKADKVGSFREFYFEYTDFQHAYQPGVYVGMRADGLPISEHDIHNPWSDANLPGVIGAASIGETFRDAIQPPVRKQASTTNTDEFPIDIWEFPPVCKGHGESDGMGGTLSAPRPCPEAITADDPGMYVVNYRNESLLARIFDPNKPGPDAPPWQDCSGPDRTGCGAQADGRAGDLAFAMDTNTTRQIPELNSVQGLAPAGYFRHFEKDDTKWYCSNGAGGTVFCPPITRPEALAGGDPFTPMMRVMDGDYVRAKMQAGGQEEEHTGTFYGLKWLQAGSGFGEAKNSGWRNAQAGGISEQFALRMPIFADYNQRGGMADYPYSFNTSIDGWSSGTWGILRSYQGGSQGKLFQLPENPVPSGLRMANARDFNKVCPKTAPVRYYDLTAISVNDVLPDPGGVNIQDLFPDSHVGEAPSNGGGTLVYNSRGTLVPSFLNPDGETVRGGQGPLHDPTAMIYVNTADLVAKAPGGTGNPNQPGFVPDDPNCWRMEKKAKYDPSLPACDVTLAPGTPIEPVVIRAAAGECLEVTLRNRVVAQAYKEVGGPDNDPDQFDLGLDYRLFQFDGKPAFLDKRGKGPQYELYADTDFDGLGDTHIADYADPTVKFSETKDLANTNAIAAVVRRDRGEPAAMGADPADGSGMTSFNNNLIKPSAYVGMYPQLLEIDVTRSLGMNVGQNPADQAVAPGSLGQYQWYAGHVGLDISTSKGGKPEGTLVATPVEFGGLGIISADPIEHGQKGLYGAGAIYPTYSTWEVDAGTTTSATVTETGTYANVFRDFTTIAAKGSSLYYMDSYPVENILGEDKFGVAEDAQDMGGMSINYGVEPMWFRFGRNPVNAAGNSKCNGGTAADCLGGVGTEEAVKAYHNSLVGEDPQTAVYTVGAGDEYRMHVLMTTGPGRGSTFDLHGAVWQRDPYVCRGDADLTISGKCSMGIGEREGLPGEGSVGSQNLGHNPIGMYLGGIESWFPGQHYEIFVPSAGGTFGVAGDYLFRDHMGLGNTGGLWGILRVE